MYEKLKERLVKDFKAWFDEIEKYGLSYEIGSFFNEDDFKRTDLELSIKLNAAMCEWDI